MLVLVLATASMELVTLTKLGKLTPGTTPTDDANTEGYCVPSEKRALTAGRACIPPTPFNVLTNTRFCNAIKLTGWSTVDIVNGGADPKPNRLA